MAATGESRIQLVEERGRVRVCAGAVLIAATERALRLEERGYPARFYIPQVDIAADRLRASDTRTHCPFKGDAAYFDVRLDDAWLADAAWRYPRPLADMAAIAHRVAFDHPRLTLHIERR